MDKSSHHNQTFSWPRANGIHDANICLSSEDGMFNRNPRRDRWEMLTIMFVVPAISGGVRGLARTPPEAADVVYRDWKPVGSSLFWGSG